jgi:Family of unknown function (DUF5317)
MGLAVLVLAGAGLLGFVLGGSVSSLVTLPLRDRWLVVVAVLAQVAGGVAAWGADSSAAYAVGLAASALAALGFCLRNLRVRGVPLVTLGLLLNALVVGINGAMPVSLAAAARAGTSITSIAAGTDPRHDVAGAGTTLRTLGDVVPIPLPLRPEVASPGDVLVAAGLAELLCLGMRRRRVQRPGTPLKHVLRAQSSR